MKNFMGFKEFSLQESYYSDYSYLRDTERSTELGKRLEMVRRRVKEKFPEESYIDSSGYSNSVNFLFGKAVSGLLGLGAATSDLFKKSDRKDLEGKSEDPERAFSGWREDLGPVTTEGDLANFVRKSEESALKRYGKSWNYNKPEGQDQERFAEAIRKGEAEIIKRMKR